MFSAVVLSGGANAVTDVNGNYSITVPSNAVLEVSCLGYATQNVNVNGRSVIDIVLTEDAEMLQDTVLAAVNEMLARAQEVTNRQLGAVTGGMNMPGMPGMF